MFEIPKYSYDIFEIPKVHQDFLMCTGIFTELITPAMHACMLQTYLILFNGSAILQRCTLPYMQCVLIACVYIDRNTGQVETRLALRLYTDRPASGVEPSIAVPTQAATPKLSILHSPKHSSKLMGT